MTRDTSHSRGLEVVTRWRVLAEQRLEYLTELYQSGRWQRYHTEQAFIDNVRDAKRAVEAWRKLAPPPIEQPTADILDSVIWAWPDDMMASDSGAVSLTQLAALADGVGPDHHLGEA